MLGRSKRLLSQTNRFFNFSAPTSFTKFPKLDLCHQPKAINSDVAGTLVDPYGRAALNAFSDRFSSRGLHLTLQQIVGPMGAAKEEHINILMDEMREEWKNLFGRYPTPEDNKMIYNEFTVHLNKILPQYTQLTPHTLLFLKFIKEYDIPFGLTTGYTRQSADLATSVLRSKFSNAPMISTSSDEIAGGSRISMIAENIKKMRLHPEDISHTLFFTDATSDVINVSSAQDRPFIIGVAGASVLMKIINNDIERALTTSERSKKEMHVTELLHDAGAHLVISDMSQAKSAYFAIWEALQMGMKPQDNEKITLVKQPQDLRQRNSLR